MPVSAYFFYGQETYPAFQRIKKLTGDLSSGPDQAPDVERFDLKSRSWAEILDSARTMPLLFSSKRLIAVQSPRRKKPNTPTPQENLSDEDKALIREYFSSPSPHTVMVIIFPGDIKPFSDLVRFFSSLGKNIKIERLFPLKDGRLAKWITDRFREEGKSISEEAVQRLMELKGNDLALLEQESIKLAVFMGEEKSIGPEHVNEISGWGKSFLDWDFSDHLEAGNYRGSVLVLDRLLEKEGLHPVQIIHLTAGFLQNVLLAKLRLVEGKKDRKAIFREIHPNIKESYRDLYNKKFNRLFSTAGRLSFEDIRSLVRQLRRIDLKIKSTGLPFQPLMDEWIFRYCRRLKEAARGSSLRSA